MTNQFVINFPSFLLSLFSWYHSQLHSSSYDEAMNFSIRSKKFKKKKNPYCEEDDGKITRYFNESHLVFLSLSPSLFLPPIPVPTKHGIQHKKDHGQ